MVKKEKDWCDKLKKLMDDPLKLALVVGVILYVLYTLYGDCMPGFSKNSTSYNGSTDFWNSLAKGAIVISP